MALSVRVCLAAPSTISWSPWSMTGPDGGSYQPQVVEGASSVPIYPNGAKPYAAGECAAGVLPFDVPSAATGVRYATVARTGVEVVTWR